MSDKVRLTIGVDKEIVDSVPEGYDAGRIEARRVIQGDMYYDGEVWRHWSGARSCGAYLVAPRKQRTAAEVVAGLRSGDFFGGAMKGIFYLVTSDFSQGGRNVVSSQGKWSKATEFTGTEADIKILGEGD